MQGATAATQPIFGNSCKVVYIKLKDALRVISHYFPEMASIGSNMLLRETTSSPVTIVKQASVAFGCGQTVWTKHVRLDDTNSRTEFEDWDEIEPSRRKQVKCIAFPEFVLKDSDSYDEENSDDDSDEFVMENYSARKQQLLFRAATRQTRKKVWKAFRT